MKKIIGFDLLRGLCALAVAVYHLLYWSNVAELHSWGQYGVYIFFVLSGASMVVAYRDKFSAGFPASTFLGLRFARLAPLYMVVMVVYGFHAVITQTWGVEWVAKAVLNSTFLFGLGNPGDNARVLGGWSLGIEFVFYLIFPAMLCFRQLWVAVLLAVSQLVFVNLVVYGNSLEAVWGSYTQPLSFIAYFYFGCLIGHHTLDGNSKPGWPMWICFAAILMGSGPSPADTLTGLRGATLFALSIAVVYFAASVRFNERIASFLGDTSYGVYLLHPFGFAAVKNFLPLAVAIPVSLVLTMVLAKVSFEVYESKIRNWAKRM
jgi:exopolysaccharide production protein ExoZ